MATPKIKYHIKHGFKNKNGNWFLCERDKKPGDYFFHTMVFKDGRIYLKDTEGNYVLDYTLVCQNCIKAALGPVFNLDLFLAKGTPPHIYKVLKNELSYKFKYRPPD